MAKGTGASIPKTDKGYTPLRKITIATVKAKPTLKELMAASEKNETVPIMDVWGVATRAKAGKSDYGDFLRFVGQFRAINLRSGESFRAAVCLLPRFLEEELEGILGAPGTVNAEFGVRITAKFDEDAASKYVYLADAIIEPAEMKLVAALTDRIGKARLLLPATVKVPAQ